MAELHNFLVNFVVFAMLLVSILAFGITLQINNETSENLNEDPLLNSTYQLLKGNLSRGSAVMEGQREAFETEDPQASTITGEITLFTIVSSGRKISGILLGLSNIFLTVPAAYLGVDESIIAGIAILILASIIIFAYILAKVGS
jgi:hypothetical protein